MNVDVVELRKQRLIVKLNSICYRSAVIGRTDGLFDRLCFRLPMLSPGVLDIGLDCVSLREVCICFQRQLQ